MWPAERPRRQPRSARGSGSRAGRRRGRPAGSSASTPPTERRAGLPSWATGSPPKQRGAQDDGREHRHRPAQATRELPQAQVFQTDSRENRDRQRERSDQACVVAAGEAWQDVRKVEGRGDTEHHQQASGRGDCGGDPAHGRPQERDPREHERQRADVEEPGLGSGDPSPCPPEGPNVLSPHSRERRARRRTGDRGRGARPRRDRRCRSSARAARRRAGSLRRPARRPTAAPRRTGRPAGAVAHGPPGQNARRTSRKAKNRLAAANAWKVTPGVRSSARAGDHRQLHHRGGSRPLEQTLGGKSSQGISAHALAGATMSSHVTRVSPNA